MPVCLLAFASPCRIFVTSLVFSFFRKRSSPVFYLIESGEPLQFRSFARLWKQKRHGCRYAWINKIHFLLFVKTDKYTEMWIFTMFLTVTLAPCSLLGRVFIIILKSYLVIRVWVHFEGFESHPDIIEKKSSFFTFPAVVLVSKRARSDSTHCSLNKLSYFTTKVARRKLLNS